MRDSAVKGILSGVAGGIAYQVFVWVFYLLGIADITPFQVGAYILIKPGLDITTLSAQALGMVQHFANSCILGLIAVLVIRWLGSDYLWIKGVSYGAVIYFLLYGVIARTIIPVRVLQPNLSTSAVFLFGNLAFGVTTTLVAGYLLREESLTRK